MKKFFLTLLCALLMVGSGCARSAQSAGTSVESVPATDPIVPLGVVKHVPETVAGADVLRTLASYYPGQVVLVDFWATWCGPCRAAMRTIDAIKPALQEKGVVFVYLTGETSPEGTWNEMLVKIEGDHYRLTGEQWQTMCEGLNLRGIPSYLIIGKDGKTAWDNIAKGGYPGNEVLENQCAIALSAQ